jgi:hemin uptake protein HemP
MSVTLHPAANALSPPALEAPTRAESGAGRPGRNDSVVSVSSTVLFRGAGELLIDHHGTLYRLKKTSLGKLILTK